MRADLKTPGHSHFSLSEETKTCIKVIIFKIGSCCLNMMIPVVLPLLEAIIVLLFWPVKFLVFSEIILTYILLS
jgi:hypothetical protein